MRHFLLSIVVALGLSSSCALAQETIDRALEWRELGWSEGDTPASFVDRIRQAAKEKGGDCAAEETGLNALAQGAGAEFSGDTAVAGQPLKVTWRTGAATVLPPPSWLIVAVDGPARFQGSQFYALTPGAMAPFGLEQGQGQTRALVALFGRNPPGGGEIDIIPLNAGELKITAYVAGFLGGCGRSASREVASRTVAVAASPQPVFFVRDPFSFEAPKTVLLSPDNRTTAELYDGRYRLVEAGTKAVLADREGIDVNYSPTGRFLVARNGDGFDMLDTADGAAVAFVENGDIGWENADSFVVSAAPSYGALEARNTLVGGYQLGFGEGLLDCTVCPGLGTRFNLDLENDVAFRRGGQGVMMTRLSGGNEALHVSIVDPYDEELVAGVNASIDDYVAGETGALPVYQPEHWNFRGGLRLSSTVEPYQPTGDEAFDRWLRSMTDGIVRAAAAPPEAKKAPGTLQLSMIGQWRGAAALARPKVSGNAMLSRLNDFGIRLSPTAEPVFSKAGGPDRDADLVIARRIEAAVPAAKGFFEPMGDFGCSPDKAADGSQRAYALFDNAMEFEAPSRTIWLTLLSCKWTAGAPFEQNFYLFDSGSPTGITRLGAENPRQPDGAHCTDDIANCAIQARLYGGRELLIWSQPSRTAMLYDIDTGKVLFQRFDLERGELLKDMYYAAEDGHILQVNGDDSFFVYDVRQGERVLEGRYVDDEVVVWTPDLRFDASPEGANYVNLRFPGQAGQHTFQQFSRTVRKPGLVGSVMRRGYVPATGGIGVPPQISGEISLAGKRLRGEVSTRNAAEIRVYQDGLATDVLPAAVDGNPLAVDVGHVAGARWVSLVAADKSGLVSMPVGLDLGAVGGGLPVVHALTIGVDRYEADELADLRFAARDSRTLYEALRAQDGKSLRLATGANLLDEQASPAAILDSVRQTVEAAKAGETIVVSFAGHGLAGPDGRFYMATSGTKLSDIGGTALPWEQLASVLLNAKARVVVFLDACHSGAAGTSFFATNDEAASGVLQSIPSGLLIFSASKGRQLSEEAAELGGGVFTNAVADVIARQRADFDLDGNGAIEVSELYAGVKRRVSELTSGRQVPWLARNEMVGDFALF